MTAAMFCAICTDPTAEDRSRLEPVDGKPGATIRVCNDCTLVHPRTGRYGFHESSRRPGAGSDGVGQGNKRRGVAHRG